MRKQLVLVGLTAVFSAGAATPALADTAGSGEVCDSLFPSCSVFGYDVDMLDGTPTVWGVDCQPNSTLPTVTSYCIYYEIDRPLPF